MNFNTDLPLWVSFFRSNPSANLTYCDGAVYVNGAHRATFSSNKQAMDTMEEARKQAALPE